MATGVWALTPAETELVSLLTEDEIPTKLRCAICSKLAVNAWKLPCCDQLIDDACHATLPSTCPVCEHTPLSSDDCKPSKAMRSTIKVFVKGELKKREAIQPKGSRISTPVTPIDSKPNIVASQGAAQSTQVDSAKKENEIHVAENRPRSEEEEEEVDQSHMTGALKKSASDLKDEQSVQDQSAERPNNNKAMQMVDQNADVEVANVQNMDQAGEKNEEDPGVGDEQNSNDFNGGFGLGAMNGAFPNMNFGGDFNQMQMMMAMQNGMMPNNFNFPMMGMSGTGMDPMTQNMYMNGGFGSQGMDMNGMNGMNGMNMMGGGFGGGIGSGSSNWNGQQSWNVGQDNFSHPNASGMGNGDFGSYNSGFHTGYNQQGNFGHQNQYNYHRGYGRGRGRGRGYYGGGYNRGGGYHNSYGHANYQDQNYVSQQYSANAVGQVPDGLENGTTEAGDSQPGSNVDEFGRTIRLRAESGAGQESDTNAVETSTTTKAQSGDPGTNLEDSLAAPPGEDASSEALPAQASGLDSTDGAAHSVLAPDDSLPAQSGDAVSATDSAVRSSGPLYDGFQGQAHRGGRGSMAPPALPPPDVPLNAPSGPKAMRQGLPNTSLLHLRARGYNVSNEPLRSPKTNGSGLPSPAAERVDRQHSRSSSPETSKRRDSEYYRERSRDRGKDRDRKYDRDSGEYDRDRRERSESRSSRSRSRDRRDSQKQKRHRWGSVSEDGYDDGYHRRGRHRSNRKYSTYDDDEEPKTARSREDKYEERSRSTSPDDSRRSAHRSRRDRDSEKRRDREKDKERDGEREHRRRSHRDRDYERDRDGDRDRDKDKDRGKDRARGRDRDREHRHRSTKKSTDEPPTPIETSEQEFNPPTGPRAVSSRPFEIKGASAKSREATDTSRRSSQASVQAPSGPASTDIYAAEREKRTRERLVAEAQKLAGMSSLTGGKRGRDDSDEGRQSRRKNRRGEIVSMDDYDERLRRGEAEREGRREG